MSDIAINERLSTLQYTVDDTPHIVVDTGQCGACSGHSCIYFCPARCFTPNGDGGIDYYYVGCVECGTCLLMCERDAVRWSYPKGGYGINYRF